MSHMSYVVFFGIKLILFVPFFLCQAVSFGGEQQATVVYKFVYKFVLLVKGFLRLLGDGFCATRAG